MFSSVHPINLAWEDVQLDNDYNQQVKSDIDVTSNNGNDIAEEDFFEYHETSPEPTKISSFNKSTSIELSSYNNEILNGFNNYLNKPITRSNSLGSCDLEELAWSPRSRTESLVDQLLNGIHLTLRKTENRRYSRGSDTSSLSPPDCFYRKPHIRRANLLAKDICELQLLLSTLECDIKRMNAILLHYLKRKDRLLCQRGQFYDIITAALQAISPKRRVDTKMRFSIEPVPGDSGFNQWHDAMRMVARLPGGIPNEFRKKLWSTLSERHITSRNINWSKTLKFCFNEKCNPEDDSLGAQIVKDLHRTGCSMFSGEDSEHNQALLKQVLLAYARWNRSVGYCQGFNMLAAIILEVMNWDVDDSLKVMIYLIEGVLPTSYFANNLRGLSVDMAAFRDLLRLRLPELSKHLDKLQNEATDLSTGASYEPPLVNVFTMQWFLTLFSNCLPKPSVLRIWDLIFLEGNEILIRTALAIWDCLQDRIINVESADEFYSIMGVLTREMMEFGVKDTNELVKTICTMAPFPFPHLTEFREKYTFNIRPLTSLVKKGVNLFCSDEEEDDTTTDPIMVASWCLSNAFNGNRGKEKNGSRATSPSGLDGFGNSLSMIGPSLPNNNNNNNNNSTNFLSTSNVDPQRMSLDISLLKKQYMKLKERQRQAHIILIEGFQNAQSNSTTRRQSLTVNHLLQGKTALISKRPRKPCPVRTPTIQPLLNRCPSNKKMLSERSKTLSNLNPILQNTSEPEKPKESGETLHWSDLRTERKKHRLTRKLSEPSLSICRESSGDEEFNNEPKVAFIATVHDDVDRDKVKAHSSDSDENVHSESSSIPSSNTSSSTELCDEIDDDLTDCDSLPENSTDSPKSSHEISKSPQIDRSLRIPGSPKNLRSPKSPKTRKNKSKEETNQSQTEMNCNDKSAKTCLNFNETKNDSESETVDSNKSARLPSSTNQKPCQTSSVESEKLETKDSNLSNHESVHLDGNSDHNSGNQNEPESSEDHYADIKRELSDLSVEQCIQKLNEKMSSLNSK